MTRREQVVIGLLSTAIIAGSGAMFLSGGGSVDAPKPDGVDAVTLTPESPAVPPAADSEIVPESAPAIAVAIQGAVKEPGLYRLDSEARVQDLIDEGRLEEDADISSLNVAARLIDGTTLTIPRTIEQDRRGRLPQPRTEQVWNPPAYTLWGSAALQTVPPSALTSSTQRAANSAGSSQSTKLDLNRATADDLEGLPGIGPSLAASIIEYRNSVPFRTVEDLMQVSGIGEKRLAAVRDLVTVE